MHLKVLSKNLEFRLQSQLRERGYYYMCLSSVYTIR